MDASEDLGSAAPQMTRMQPKSAFGIEAGTLVRAPADVARIAGLEAQLLVLGSPELLEALAAAEHERWSGWMLYQDRAPADKRADWPRKAATPYADLTHEEQESDRIESRKSLAIINEAMRKLAATRK